ncbi:ADP-ribosylation factor 1 [Biomphalaria pfeifferi]|uniref:ADP-ribosylation factor 1 n=1 Tax=Biomphalaria pfeifferi TaxID=112525 RepID=A0AAD8FG20_BIOPF|nr:ADP-ribosylation factor 1 [Biomphalaria pfeifferi]
MSSAALSLARVKVKMGNLWARLRHKDVRIILLGLDSAGKTTILYRLKLDDLVTTIPTIGFNVESIQYKDLHLTAWDIGSRDKIRPLFRHYYKGADAVVFVIDSHDPERLDELNYDVIKPAMNAEELTSAVFLFLANKIDLPDTMSVEEISERLGLKYLKHPWGIIPVSAVSGEGLQDALQWLAIRLGSAQVKPRNFTTNQPQKQKSMKECNTQSSLSSGSSTGTSRTDNSKTASTGGSIQSPQKPIIFVNSKLYMDTRAAQSLSSGSVDNTSSPMSAPMSSVSTPSSNYRYAAYTPRKTPGSVMNSFSSYSIAQSMQADMSRRKYSAISRSDIRKLSCASLNDTPGARKLSAASLLDCPNARKMSSVSLMESPYRRKMSTSFVIDPPCYRKFSSVSLMDTPSGRKLSIASLGDPRLTDTPFDRRNIDEADSECVRKLSAVSLGDQAFPDYRRKLSAVSLTDSKDNVNRPKMSYLSADPTALSTPPTSKRRSEDLSLQGFGSFTPIMADYIHNDRKDSDTSADSLNIVSPSEHLQPHLRPLGLKKSPFMSNSAKYVVNSIEAEKETHYEELFRLLPDRMTNLNAYRESFLIANEHLGRNQNLLSALDQTNGNSSNVPNNNETSKSNHIKKGNKSSRQSSQDSDSSSSSGNGKRSNLDLFCTPTKRWHSQSRRNRNQMKGNNMSVLSSSHRGAYCSRAYSAFKCLFFRPTKEEMQHETNSISSDDENENCNNHCTNNRLDNHHLDVKRDNPVDIHITIEDVKDGEFRECVIDSKDT